LVPGWCMPGWRRSAGPAPLHAHRSDAALKVRQPAGIDPLAGLR
jgi:hypothetical protein